MLSTILSVILAVVSMICALLLIGIILIQQSKAGGGLGAVSGGVTESMFGASAANVLTKATTWIAAVFLVSTLLLAASAGRFSRKNVSAAETAPTTAKTAADTAAPAAAETKDAAAQAVDEAGKAVDSAAAAVGAAASEVGTAAKEVAAKAVEGAAKAVEGAAKAVESVVKDVAGKDVPGKVDPVPAKDAAKAP